jgi:phage regulator Rha-like protein
MIPHDVLKELINELLKKYDENTSVFVLENEIKSILKRRGLL